MARPVYTLSMAHPPLILCFSEDVDKVIDKYRDQGLTVGEACGSLFMIATKLTIEGMANESRRMDRDLDELLLEGGSEAEGSDPQK